MALTNKSIFYILLIITAIIIFGNLSGIPLLDPDEPVYAETPREMIIYSDFLSPRIYGEYWYDKPPMYYWLVAASFTLFGAGEFAARFPSALLSLVTIILVYFAGSKVIGKRGGIIAAFVLATSIEFFYLGKAAVTDITLNLFLTASLLSFIRNKYYLFYLFAGLATLTKGPIGLFFPAVIVFLYLLLTRNLQRLKTMKIFSGTLLFAAVAIPWYAIMYHFHGSAFIETFLGFHNITRFTSPEHPSGTLWYYYIPVLLIGFFPWITTLGQAVFQSFIQPRNKANELLFFNIWATVIFIFFTISQTKLVSYILPMYPALALLVGWHIDKQWSNWYGNKRQYIWGGLMAFLLILFSIGSYLSIPQLPSIEHGVYALIAIFTIWLLAFLWFIWQKRIANLVISNIIAMTMTALVISYMLFPAIAPEFAAKDTAQEFKTLYDGKSEVYISKFLRPGFAFYSGIYGQELYFSKDLMPDIEKIIAIPGQSYFILRTMDYERINATARNKMQVLKTVNNKIILQKKSVI